MLVRVTLSGTLYELGVVCQNVLHLENLDGLLTLEQIAQDFQANWLNTVRNFQTNVFRWDWIGVRNMDNLGEVPYVHTLSPVIVGASSNNIMHPCVNWLMRLRSNQSGRMGRGRLYIPGVHSVNMTRTRPSTAGFTSFNSNKTALMRYVAGGGANIGMHLVIAHKNVNIPPTQVNDLQLAPILAIQRRRNELVGI